jgi:F0F1-type ATP synthase epsilon subunit
MFKVSVLDIKNASPIFKNSVSEVVLPGEDGEMAVLDFHQSFISTLDRGTIKIDGSSIRIKGGIAGMKENELVILIEKE